MKVIAISQAEIDALYGQPAHVFRLYVVLRARMDKDTGLVGRRGRISYQALGEELEEDAVGRRQAFRPDKSAIRRMVASLKRIGLVADASRGEERLVFELPQAVRPQSARNKNDTTTTQLEVTHNDTHNGTLEPGENGALSLASDTGNDTHNGTTTTHHNDTHQVSSISTPNGVGPDGPEEGKRRVWRLWRELVGDTPANARILGKCIKDHGEERVSEAVLSTYAKAPADPVAYLRGCLRDRPRIHV